MGFQTQIIAEQGKQELFIIREFDAPRDLVFKAFSTPELLVKFHAPFGAKMTFNHADYKSGGAYRWTLSDEKGNIFCIFKGVIHELSAPERIIQTAELEGSPESGNVVLAAYTFENLPNGRTKMTIQEICRSVVDRDTIIQSGMEHGLVIVYNQLDELIRQNKI